MNPGTNYSMLSRQLWINCVRRASSRGSVKYIAILPVAVRIVRRIRVFSYLRVWNFRIMCTCSPSLDVCDVIPWVWNSVPSVRLLFCFVFLRKFSRFSSTLLQESIFDGKRFGKAALLGSCGSHFRAHIIYSLASGYSLIYHHWWTEGCSDSIRPKTFLAKKCTDCMDIKALAKMLWMDEPDRFW